MTLKYFLILQLLLILIPGSIHEPRDGPLVTLVGFQRPIGCGGTILTDRHFLTTATCTYTTYTNSYHNKVEHPSLVKGAYFIEDKPTVSQISTLTFYKTDKFQLNSNF